MGPPSEILSGLWLGDACSAEDSKLMKKLGMTHILTIGNRPLPDTAQETFIYKYIFAYDSDSQNILCYFQECFNFIKDALLKGRIFVHCQMGFSRSATVVIGYLMKTEELKYKEAFDKVWSVKCL